MGSLEAWNTRASLCREDRGEFAAYKTLARPDGTHADDRCQPLPTPCLRVSIRCISRGMKARRKFKVGQRVKSTGEVVEKDALGRVVGFTREGWVKVRLLDTETVRVDHPDFWESAPPSR